jgi:hypothetical protein
MRFMLTSVSLDPGNPAPTPELFAALGKLTEEMTSAGKLVEGGGMGMRSTRVTLTGGEIVVDAPFAEAKEVVGGYAVVQVASHDEAIEMARRFLDLHRRILGSSYRAENEIRRLYGPWDAPEGSRG